MQEAGRKSVYVCVAVAANSSNAVDTVSDGQCGGLAAVDNLLVDPVHLPAQQQGEHHLPHGRQVPVHPMPTSYALDLSLHPIIGNSKAL